jgi:4-diphosphocytidyl-2-C-methyl-D-erythritol kinase
MLFFPNAKINLGLRVLSQRSDGYHNIETLMYPVPLTDVAEFITDPDTSSPDSTACRCFGHQPDEHTVNLCVKACQLIREDYNTPPVEICLYKHIPIGAGLGGGSADGAFMLKAMNDYFSLGISEADLTAYALRLGSDCPFFIRNVPAIVSGRGEIIRKVDFSLEGFQLALIFPWIRLNTRDIYARQQSQPCPMSIDRIITGPPESWKGLLKNQFENYIFEQYPVIKTIKEELYRMGAVYASMTGSGSAVYGLFREPVVFDDRYRSYFLWQGKL